MTTDASTEGIITTTMRVILSKFVQFLYAKGFTVVFGCPQLAEQWEVVETLVDEFIESEGK